MDETKQASQDQRKIKLSAIAVLIAAVAYYFTKYKQSAILPIIAGDLDGMAYYTWAAILYSLTSCIAAPFWGKIGDMIGRKKVLIYLILFLTIGDLLSAFSPNIFVFIVANGICGFGAGAMLATLYSYISDLFAPDKRGKYGGYMMVLMNVITIFLPLLAAFIAQNVSWRYVFVLTSVVYVIALICVIKMAPNFQGEKKKLKMDYVGIVLITLGAVPFLLALTWGGSKYAWNNPIELALLIGGIAILVIAAFYENAHPDFSLISFKLLRNRNYTFAILISLFMTSTMTAFGSFGPLLVQGVMSQPATVWSAASIPSAIIGIFAGGAAGWAMDKTKRYKWLLAIGPLAGTVCMVWFTLLSPTAAIGFIVGIAIVERVFTGYMPSINSLAALAMIDDEADFGAAGGTMYFITGLGQAVWPAIMGSVFNGSYNGALANTIASISKQLNPAQMKMISTSRILVTPASMKQLQTTFGDNKALYNQTVEAVRAALRTSLNTTFIVAGIISLGAVIMVLLIKEVPLDQIKQRKKR